MDQTSRNIREYIDNLNEYIRLYDLGKPIISDKEYDEMYFALKKMEEETGIIYPDSPTQTIQYNSVTELSKTLHNHPMLSLDKSKDVEDIVSFVKGQDWFGMFKMDGLTCSLTYEDGKLVRAETRGNGTKGENITHNAFVIPSIPKTIPTKEFVTIDGEIVCDLITFEKYFKNDYANPRNLAAGAIRLLSSQECASRRLTFVAWDLIRGCEDIDLNLWRLEKLDEWGFITVPRVGDAETIEDAIELLDKKEEHKIWPIDGYVFKFESKKYGDSLGQTEHHLKNAIAFKFYDEEYETELVDIEWSMGRTGVLTPVAIFKPVDTGDSVIERASLHNLSMMKAILGEYPDKNEKVWVAKINMIIPQIVRANRNNTPHDHILDNGVCNFCPICGAPTKTVKSDGGVYNIICDNPSCEGKLANRIDHYCGKKGLDIKGFSLKTIEKLIEWGWVSELSDIYRLDRYRTEWESKSGFGKASVGKILDAINAEGRHPKLESFIAAIGIPNVGNTIAKEIVKYYPTWEEFRAAVGGNWTEFNGFGDELNNSINNFDYSEADIIVAEMLAFEQPEVSENDESTQTAAGLTFCITGKVTNWKNRDELKAYIESIGGKVTTSVSSKTSYLINNDSTSTSSKNVTAKKNNVPIITEAEFIDAFGQNK